MSMIELWRDGHLYAVNKLSGISEKWAKFRKINFELAQNRVEHISKRIERRKSFIIANKVIDEVV